MNRVAKVQSRVEHCLREFPATREDDALLIISVCKNFYRDAFCHYLVMSVRALGMEAPTDLEDGWRSGSYKDLPSSETITRIRRKFNNEGMYLPTDPKVMKSRGLKVKEFQEFNRDFEA